MFCFFAKQACNQVCLVCLFVVCCFLNVPICTGEGGLFPNVTPSPLLSDCTV